MESYYVELFNTSYDEDEGEEFRHFERSFSTVESARRYNAMKGILASLLDFDDWNYAEVYDSNEKLVGVLEPDDRYRYFDKTEGEYI